MESRNAGTRSKVVRICFRKRLREARGQDSLRRAGGENRAGCETGARCFSEAGRQQTLTADNCALHDSVFSLRTLNCPALSTQQGEIIKQTRYDAVSRVYLQTKNRFWEEKGLNGFAFTSGAIEIWQPTWSQPGPRGILMTYARPGEAERITRLKEKERIATTLKQLDGIFSGLAREFRTRRDEVLDGRRMVARRVGVRRVD